jgi:hypothetical protein
MKTERVLEDVVVKIGLCSLALAVVFKGSAQSTNGIVHFNPKQLGSNVSVTFTNKAQMVRIYSNSVIHFEQKLHEPGLDPDMRRVIVRALENTRTKLAIAETSPFTPHTIYLTSGTHSASSNKTSVQIFQPGMVPESCRSDMSG